MANILYYEIETFNSHPNNVERIMDIIYLFCDIISWYDNVEKNNYSDEDYCFGDRSGLPPPLTDFFFFTVIKK